MQAFIPLFMVLTLCAAYAKLGAHILHRTLSWRDSSLFALLLAGVAIAGSVTFTAFDFSLPIALGVVVGLAINLLLGGWFFGTRAADTQGLLLGWSRGMALSVITFALLAATIVALMGVVHVLTPLAHPIIQGGR